MSKFDPLHVQCAVKQQYQPVFTGTNQPRLLYVSNIRPQTSMYPRMLHAHADAVELALMYSGSGKFFIHDRYVPVSAGDLLIYNSGVIHDEISSADNPIGMYCITFSGLHMPGLRPNALIADDRNCVISCGEHFESVRFLFELMFKQLSSDYPNASFFCHNMMEALLVQALTLAADAPQKPIGKSKRLELALDVKQYLDAHYTEPITLTDIGQHLHVSHYYLCHVFKDLMGYAPMKYLLRRRLGEAQTLLISTDTTISKIAESVGFDTQSYFNFQFAKNVGMPPSQYRKNYLVRAFD